MRRQFSFRQAGHVPPLALQNRQVALDLVKVFPGRLGDHPGNVVEGVLRNLARVGVVGFRPHQCSHVALQVGDQLGDDREPLPDGLRIRNVTPYRALTLPHRSSRNRSRHTA